MNKIIHNKTKTIVAIGLFIILCSAWAMAPLWVNPCVSTHLSEEEIEQLRTLNGYKDLTPEKQAKVDRLHREAEIPCGAQDLPLLEKLNASYKGGGVLSELGFVDKLIILRFEMVDTDEDGGAYYFKAYTFFYIPLYRAFAGGSGYMEIDMLPFETHEGIDIGEWK